MSFGTHLIGDFYLCDFEKFLNKNNNDFIKKYYEKIVIKNGLNILNSSIYTFENGSFSLNIMLLESHICIHTWPEKKYISMDVFVCNYSKDNSLSAEKIFNTILATFYSDKKNIQIIKR